VIASFCPSFRGADSSYSWRSFRGSRHYLLTWLAFAAAMLGLKTFEKVRGVA